MSHALPEDPSRWPSDPYELLGVAHGVSPRDLRKAYTNLIRTYKPEHHPEEFRRIRQAFETLQRYAAYSFTSDEQTAESNSLPEQTGAPDAAAESPAIPQGPSIDQLWELAVTGDAAGAYRSIVEFLDRSPGREDLYARLYWLAVLYPEVAGDFRPAEWLVRGMTGREPGGLLFALYSAEVRDNPAEAASDRFERLLKGVSSEQGLSSLLRLRWQSLGRVDRWRIVHDDFRNYRERLRRAGEHEWLGLIYELRTWLPWDEEHNAGNRLANDIRKEIQSLEHLALQASYYFDQFEYLELLERDWNYIKRGPSKLENFLYAIEASWSAPFERIRPRIDELLRDISDSPIKWLGWLDRTPRRGRMALMQFYQLLSTYKYELGLDDTLPHAPAQIRQYAESALYPHSGDEDRLRANALAYCLEECSGPDLIAEAFHPSVNGPTALPGWLEYLQGDLSLQIVCRAARLFRA